MKKQIHDQLIEFYRDNISRLQQDHIERLRQTDNVIVWLTALSTGSIALILSQSDNLNINNQIYLKISVAMLLLSIISGVTYRSIFYPLEALIAENFQYFEGFCHGRRMEVSGPIEITENHKIEDIAKSLKEDMGLDYDSWLEYDHLNRDFWVEHYNHWARFWEDSEEKGLMDLSKALAILNNKDPKTAKNILEKSTDEERTRRKIFIFSVICKTAYHLTLIFFVLSIISVSIGYITS